MVSLLKQLGQQDEALREWVGAVVSPPSAEPSVEELTRRFESDARCLGGVLSVVEDQDPATVAAALDEVLRTWEHRLSCADDAAGRLVPLAFRAFLKSRALESVLAALSTSARQHQVIHEAAIAVAGEASTATGPQQAAGEALASLLLRASVASPALLSELLGLLANAVEVAELCSRGRLVVRGAAVEEDANQVLSVIAATFRDGREAEAWAATLLCQAIELSLCSSPPSRNSVAGPKSGAPSKSLPAGSEVWASWAGDGRWYRARVKSVSTRYVLVNWLAPQGDINVSGDEDEYLEEANSALFNEVAHSAVMLVEESIRRPVPSPADELPDDQWSKRLSAAKAQSLHLRELRSLCAELAVHRKTVGLGLSAVPDEAPLGTGLSPFREGLLEQSEGLSGQEAECSGDARCIEEQIQTSSGAMELELQAVEAKRAQMSTQVADIRKHREDLLAQQQQLAAQLGVVAEELAAAEAAEAELKEREELLHASRHRVTAQLQQQLELAQQRSDVAARRRRTLAAAAEASHMAEQQLTARAAAIDVGSLGRLEGKETAMGAASLESDLAQRCELSELLECWHGAVWGPDAVALPRNPAQATALRAAHLQAAEVVENALCIAEQAAAAAKARISGSKVLESFFGFGEADSDIPEDAGFAEQVGREVPRYKEMQQQLAKSLERLASLEKHALGVPCGKDVAAGPLAQITTRAGGG